MSDFEHSDCVVSSPREEEKDIPSCCVDDSEGENDHHLEPWIYDPEDPRDEPEYVEFSGTGTRDDPYVIHVWRQ